MSMLLKKLKAKLFRPSLKEKPIETKLSEQKIDIQFNKHLLMHPFVFKDKVIANASFIEISGSIESNIVEGTALFSVSFFDFNNKECVAEQYQSSLKRNSNFNCYSYLNSGYFKLLIVIPDEATQFSLKVRASKSSYAKFTDSISLEQGTLNLIRESESLINRLESYEQSTLNLELIDTLLKNYTESERQLLLNILYGELKSKNEELSYLLGYKLLKYEKSSKLAQDVKTILNKNGEMKRLADFLDYVNSLNVIGFNMTSNRIRDDIDKFEKGFDFSRIKPVKYSSGNDVLYLLHNSLPYNSGGYATRTHGLLTTLNKLGDFKVMGVTRPGFPSDHKKYISKKLPEVIPEKDLIDNTLYYRCDQSIRKSSHTISDYLELFSNELIKLSNDNNLGIIHGVSNHPNGLTAVLAAKSLGVKSVYEVRGLWEITRLSREEGWDKTEQYKYVSKMEAEACNHADHVITITHALKDIMIDRGVDAEKITVVPNCVDVSKFTPFEKRNSKLSKDLNIGPDDVVIGYVGSIVNYEGLDDLIDAIHILVNDGINNFKVLIVGDGAYLNKLFESVLEKELQNYVIFTGRVPHDVVSDYYSLVDITPFPRKPYLVCEAVSPLKPFEAMASGKSVIVSSCAALKEIVTDNENGLVFEKGSVTSLASKLKLLIQEEELRKRLSKEGYKWVVKHRDWSVSAEKVNNIYKNLTGEIGNG